MAAVAVAESVAGIIERTERESSLPFAVFGANSNVNEGGDTGNVYAKSTIAVSVATTTAALTRRSICNRVCNVGKSSSHTTAIYVGSRVNLKRMAAFRGARVEDQQSSSKARRVI